MGIIGEAVQSVQGRGTGRRWWRVPTAAAFLFCAGIMMAAAGRDAQAAETVRIAVALSMTGDNAEVDRRVVEGARMAADEANADTKAPPVELVPFDDMSSQQGARDIARKIVAGNELIVIGPGLTTSSVAAGPIFAEAGLASLVPTAPGDAVTDNPTTFRPLFSNSQMGGELANYLHYVLSGDNAVVLFPETAYGRPVAEGFKRVADQLGIQTTLLPYNDPASAQQAAEEALRHAGENPEKSAVVLASQFPEAKSLLLPLRRGGYAGKILAASSLATEALVDQFAEEPESQQRRGFFTDDVMAATPMLLDSAGADTLAFADRFRGRFGRDPTWRSMQAYDTAKLAIAAARAAVSGGGDLRARREAALAHLRHLDSPAHAMAGVTGPLWFTPARGRQQEVRIGTFHGGVFESAPLQLVSVDGALPPEQLGSRAVVDLGGGRHGWLQRIVSTGLYINEITGIDFQRSTFSADFDFWLRFKRDAGPDSADPTKISFPTMISGKFDRLNPTEHVEMADGTVYYRWSITGEFRNNYDLHAYPFDRQILSIPVSNTNYDRKSIVYVVDQRSSKIAESASPHSEADEAAHLSTGFPGSANASSYFLHSLSYWQIVGIREMRNNVIKHSSFGNPIRVQTRNPLELSGFVVNVEIGRRALTALIKTVLPLALMTCIMYASMYFPPALMSQKVTVAVTAALSGAVLLANVNNQLGSIGYTIVAEYAFYAFFGQCLACIICVLAAERMRERGRVQTALAVEKWTQLGFKATIAATLIGLAEMYWTTAL